MTSIIVGLGNPGSEYAGTRHNVGFEVLDRLATHEGLIFESPRSLDGYTGPKGFSVARSFEPDAIFVKPETFMNRSGDVVAPLVRWANPVAPVDPVAPVEDGEDPRAALGPGGLERAASKLLVVYDDFDLPMGKLRLRPHGGAGGQNGMRSIIERLGTQAFPRLRVGIGSPGTDAARHVLSRFDPKERVEIDISVAEATDAILDWLRTGDIEGCMTRFHSRWNQGS